MRKFTFGAAVALSTLAVPAMASTVVDGSCISVKDSNGCLFSGNINSNDNGNANSFISAQNAYNTYNNTHPSANPDITLSVLAASNDTDFSDYGSITGAGTSSGTWTLTGFIANFLAVKAGDNFVLYELSAPASSGAWNTFDIPYRNNPRDLSHLVFFGSAVDGGGGVPEPATWALMILGFGAVGSAMRRRGAARRGKQELA